MKLFTIASGSSGNCICVGHASQYFLVDCGISGKRIEEGLQTHGMNIEDILGILITHEHRDHVQGLGVIARRYHIPIYLTKETKEFLCEQNIIGDVDEALFQLISPKQSFILGDFQIQAIPVSHDAVNPVSYIIHHQNQTCAIITDLGCYDHSIICALQNINMILIEANHDLRMLETGIYPYPLKKRIAGEGGHLSNEACGKLLNEILHSNMKEIILGHLSKENNFPDLALESVKLEITMSDSRFRASDFSFSVAPRNEVSKIYEI